MEQKIVGVIKKLERTDMFQLPPTLVRKGPKNFLSFGCSQTLFQFTNLFEVEDIGYCMTFIENEIYKRIQPNELLSQSWNNPEKACLSRNVVDCIQRANAVSFWVATSILLPVKLKNRIAVMTKFIEIAQYLRDVHNYNSLMGIIAGLSLAPVSRLKFTFAGLKRNEKEAFESLQELMNPTKSFQKLREALVASGKSVTPYIGMHLSDLTFIDEGNKNWINKEDGTLCINMYKQNLIHISINKLLYFQNISLNATECDVTSPIYTFLLEVAR